MLETNLVALAVHVAKLEKAAPDDRANLSSALKRDRADGADLAVGDEKRCAIAGQAARLSESRFIERPVFDIFLSASRKGAQLVMGEVEEPDLMMACHRDVELVSHAGTGPMGCSD